MGHLRSTVLLRALVMLPGMGMPISGSEPLVLDSTLSAGERVFDLDWRTASAPTVNGVNPPFTASWKGITAVEATIGLRLRAGGLQLRGEATYGRIISGSSSISAFADDSRTQTIYRSDQRSDGGDTREGTVALGIPVNITRTVDALCEFGYTSSEQRLTLTDGVQVIPAGGPYAGLDSRYLARWQGPWIGLSGSWNVLQSWALCVNCRYQWVDYRDELDLNLRSDLAHPRSIDQEGFGHAVAAGAGVIYHLTRRSDIQLLFTYEESRVADGQDHVNYSSGVIDNVPLNEVRLSAWTLRCGLRWEY